MKRLILCAVLLLALCASGCHNLFDNTPARFVAVGSAGDICWSIDGAAWACKAVSDDQLNAVAYGNGKFVAVSSNGDAYSSEDGKQWTSETISSGKNFLGITYGSGLFVAVSADATAWYYDTCWHAGTVVVSPLGLLKVAYGGGRFVATSALGVYYTDDPTDNASWQFVQLLDNTTTTFDGLTYGNGSFVIANLNNKVYIAADNFTASVDWQKIPTGIPMNFPVVTYGSDNGSDVFILAGDKKIAKSVDTCAHWEDITPKNFTARIGGGAYGDGQFILSGYDGNLYRSADGGATWEKAVFFSRPPKEQVQAIAYRAEE